MTNPLEKLQKQLTDAVFNGESVVEALETIRTLCDAQFGELLISNQHLKTLHSAYCGPFPDDIAKAEAEYHTVNPRVTSLPYYQLGKAVRDADIITRDRMAKDTAYQEFIIPSGAGYYCAVAIDKTPEHMVALVVHNSIKQDPFNSEQAKMMEAIAATCAPVFELATMIQKHEARTILEMLGEHTSAAVLGPRAEIMDMTAQFEALIRAKRLILTPDQTIDLKDRSANKHMRKWLRKPHGQLSNRFFMRGRAEQSDRICRMLPLPPSGLGITTGGVAVLQINRIENAHPLDCSLARDVFELTCSETDIAARLVQGQSIDAIASARNVKASTVISQVKSLLTKTGCHRQVELVAKLSKLTIHASGL